MAGAEEVGRRLRTLRQQRRLSTRALAAAVGFTPGFISQVELGQASPSIASLERIAAALGVTLGQFFKEEAEPPPTVVRAHERRVLRSGWLHAEVARLSPAAGADGFEALLIALEPGGRSGSGAATARHGTAFGFVLAGTPTLTLGEIEYALTTGDAVTYALETPHRWTNHADTLAQLLIVSTGQPRG